jgi:hypothetical protein
MIDFKKISKKYSNSRFSKFWDDTSNNTFIVDDFLNDGVDSKPKKKKDIMQMAGHKRAISNFVNIVTGENIPVTFKTKDGGYTDGEKVVIGGNISNDKFDTAVGLALHEGSHIKLTDFKFIPQDNIIEEIYVMAESKGYTRDEVEKQVFGLTNWVEDRRIDKYVISTSPGYRGYYHSMYDTYFNSKNVDNGLISNEYRDETWESYHFRIVNLINPNRQLKSLKGLMDIWDVLDLKNIDRLKSTQDAFDVACDIYRIVMRNVDKVKVIEQTQQEKQQGKGEPVSDEDFQELLDKIENGEFEEVDGEDEDTSSSGGNKNDDMGDDEEDGDGEEDGKKGTQLDTSNDDGTPTKELSDRQQELLNKAIQKQNKFLDGDIQKTSISKKDSRDVEVMDKSDASYQEVGYETKDGFYGHKTIKKTKCLVIKKLTRNLIESNQFDFAKEGNGRKYDRDGSLWRCKYDFVEEGIRLGTVLGRKLKVRGEETSLKFTRKNTGKIDKRLISELGFGNENVFSQVFVEKYNKAYLHISVDASYSMSGVKWNKAMTSAVAMIRACDMAGNIDVIMSIRGSYTSISTDDTPAVLVCYDSRVDKFNKVRNLFRYLDVGGLTPEGLCFEAIMKDLIPGDNNQDSYFINYSDGAPYFNNKNIYYCGSNGCRHTKYQVDNMRKLGIKVLGYFISENSGDDWGVSQFKQMYGVDSEFIQVDNMMQVSRTMNKRFLKRD